MAWYYVLLCVLGGYVALVLLVMVLTAIFGWDEKVFLYMVVPLRTYRDRKEEQAMEQRRIANEAKREQLEQRYHYQGSGGLRLKRDIPLDVFRNLHDTNYVIYYEPVYCEGANRFIEEHYDEISQQLYSEGVVFIYMPRVLRDIESSISYVSPAGSPSERAVYTAADFYRTIKDNMLRQLPFDTPCLLMADAENSLRYPADELGDFALPCYFYHLNYENDEQFSYIIDRQISAIKRFHVVRYSRVPPPEGEEYADHVTIERLSKEVSLKIQQLYALGVTDYVIQQIVDLARPALSHLLITSDFRIILTDYNDLEIKLSPLPKTLFFFYLNHPEGVLFKHLRNYRDELLTIYSLLSPRENAEAMARSIDDIIDSTKNSVNEKVSRIREAFITKVHRSIADNYCVTGRIGEAKLITLARSLVIDQSGCLSFTVK